VLACTPFSLTMTVVIPHDDIVDHFTFGNLHVPDTQGSTQIVTRLRQYSHLLLVRRSIMLTPHGPEYSRKLPRIAVSIRSILRAPSPFVSLDDDVHPILSPRTCVTKEDPHRLSTKISASPGTSYLQSPPEMPFICTAVDSVLRYLCPIFYNDLPVPPSTPGQSATPSWSVGSASQRSRFGTVRSSCTPVKQGGASGRRFGQTVFWN